MPTPDNDAPRHEHSAFATDQANRFVAEENERMRREAAIFRCDKCPKPKHEIDRLLALPNGIKLSIDCRRCDSPSPDCTALVQSSLSEPAAVANQIVQWLVEQPELSAVGASWLVTSNTRFEPDRLVLIYPTPAQEQVIAAVGAIPVEKFRV